MIAADFTTLLWTTLLCSNSHHAYHCRRQGGTLQSPRPRVGTTLYIQMIDRLLILEFAGIQPKNSTSYVLNSVSGVMPGEPLPVLNPPRYRAGWRCTDSLHHQCLHGRLRTFRRRLLIGQWSMASKNLRSSRSRYRQTGLCVEHRSNSQIGWWKGADMICFVLKEYLWC